MPARSFVGQAINNQAINASGASGVIANTTSLNSVDVEIEIAQAPTGTTPTINFQLQGSLDGLNFFNIGAATANLSAVGLTLLSNTNVDVPFLKVAYTVGGTTPNFPSVTVNIYAF